GWVTNNDDCDDSLATVNSTATEVCNSADDNCDGVFDGSSAEATPSAEWHLDADDDGFGGEAVVMSCNALLQFQGYMRDSRDCEDLVAQNGREVRDGSGAFYADPRPVKVIQPEDINPNAAEVWYDDVDQDCAEPAAGVSAQYIDYAQDHDGQNCDGSVVWPEPLCPPDSAGIDCVDGG